MCMYFLQTIGNACPIYVMRFPQVFFMFVRVCMVYVCGVCVCVWCVSWSRLGKKANPAAYKLFTLKVTLVLYHTGVFSESY